MEAVHISTRQCDTDFGELIESMSKIGSHSSQGVLLTVALPDSRPRGVDGPSTHLSQEELMNAVTFKARCLEGKIGIYILENKNVQKSQQWITWAELQGQIVPETTKSCFIECLESGQSFGEYCPIMKINSLARNTPVRRILNIKAWPIGRDDPIARLAAHLGGLKDYRWYSVSILTANAPVPMYTPVADLHAIIYHHRGSPVMWNMIPPDQKDSFESKVRQSFDMDPSSPTCDQFVTHLNLWITENTLKSWGIKFHQLVQNERQVMAIFPGSYVWGFSTGFAVIERKHWARHDWKAHDYVYCANNIDLCKSAKPSALTLDLSKEDVDVLKNASLQPPEKSQKCQRPRSKKRKLEEVEDIAIEAEDPETHRGIDASSSEPFSFPQKASQIASWPAAITPSLSLCETFAGKSNPVASTKRNFSVEDQAYDMIRFSFSANDDSDSEEDFVPTAIEKYTFNNPAVENKLLKKQLETIVNERDWLLQKNEAFKKRIAVQERYIELLERRRDVEENIGGREIDVSDNEKRLHKQGKENEFNSSNAVEASGMSADESDVWSEGEMAAGFGERHGKDGDSDDEMVC